MQPKHPLLIDRIQSCFIDLIVILLLTFLAGYLLDFFDNVPDWVRIVLFFGLWGVYEPVSTSQGGTLGNYIKGIRVRKNSQYDSRINLFQSFIRYVFKSGLGWLSFITIHMNPDRRAIHDYISGSIMLKKQTVQSGTE